MNLQVNAGAQWLLRDRAVLYRTVYRFRLRHREGRSVLNAWTVPTAADSRTPDGQTLIFVQRASKSKQGIHALPSSLSVALASPRDVGAAVFTLYQAHDTFSIGILKAVDGVGPDAKCTVEFPQTDESTTILAKFLVIVVSRT